MPETDAIVDADSVGEPAELPLDGWHRARGARMVPFAGYAMPLQYAGPHGGIIAEHDWTRTSASLFDVSHMGQILIEGEGATAALERLLPADLAALKLGHIRYSLLLDEHGGIRDDLLVTKLTAGVDRFSLVVNGATKADDFDYLRADLPRTVSLTMLQGVALLALQGPAAAAVLGDMIPGISPKLGFMRSVMRDWRGYRLNIGRSGYTGEDGFEISLSVAGAAAFADALLADERVRPAGLGARDSLRLEAGLPLYGHDLDRTTDPVSAGLAFAISKRRRAEGGYPGVARISQALAEGPARRLVGLLVEGRMPAREGAPVFAGPVAVGRATSGAFSPTLGRPIALANVESAHCAPGTFLELEVRGRRLAAEVVPLPFVPHRYHRAGASA
ncbi:MAG: glycine cleavage system aminomethyltransferase GcvT [Candidatus Andeanibacterium colombiense]|uniref:aminomethyltransferase n=1 Tax=Candidatus Andeanibacterium colombiense TaxID=3121345 RepID=A0AAJ6BPX4_9SPHN|nr:MAG: glycine cleavage system aminomethyltransferase GcvT [Sphingomonadaceae bacterium]